eukprot:jgi/Tetstr1/421230/TSEL_012234.t1
MRPPTLRRASEVSSPAHQLNALALRSGGVRQSNRLKTCGTGTHTTRAAVQQVAQLQVEVEDAARTHECGSKAKNMAIMTKLNAMLHALHHPASEAMELEEAAPPSAGEGAAPGAELALAVKMDMAEKAAAKVGRGKGDVMR